MHILTFAVVYMIMTVINVINGLPIPQTKNVCLK